MGTFLVVCGVLFCLGVSGVDKIKSDMYGADSKKRSVTNSQPVYMDGKCRWHFVETGEYCYYRSIENGYAYVNKKHELLGAYYRDGRPVECVIRRMDFNKWEDNVYNKFLLEKKGE